MISIVAGHNCRTKSGTLLSLNSLCHDMTEAAILASSMFPGLRSLALLWQIFGERGRDSQMSFSVDFMGGRLLEGPTMVVRTLDWKEELGRWLKPFLDRLGHKARRQMCPLYVRG